MVMQLLCNLQTRHLFQIKSRDQVDDFTNRLYLSRGVPSKSLNFLPYQEVEKMEAPDFFPWQTWSENHKWH